MVDQLRAEALEGYGLWLDLRCGQPGANARAREYIRGVLGARSGVQEEELALALASGVPEQVAMETAVDDVVHMVEAALIAAAVLLAASISCAGP